MAGLDLSPLVPEGKSRGPHQSSRRPRDPLRTGVDDTDDKARGGIPDYRHWLGKGMPEGKHPSTPARLLEQDSVRQAGYEASAIASPGPWPRRHNLDPAEQPAPRHGSARRGENRIEVSDQLRRPHALIQDANAIRAKALKNDHGLANSRSDSKASPSVLDIRVSPAARNRALRLLDALLKALESRGYTVSARGVMIEGELVQIGVTEKEDRTPHVATAAELARQQKYSWERIQKWDYAPSGRLSIFTDAYVWWRRDLRKRWSDGRAARLEDMLNEIVVGLVAIGVALRQRTEERRREAEIRAEQERQRQELARQARMEKARRENLIAETTAWTQAERIRDLVAAVRERTATEPNLDAHEIEAWIGWAARIASDLDPLSGGLQRLLAKHQHVAEEAGKPERLTPYGYG